MPKRDNAVRLLDRYDLKDLEPDVDPAKAAAFLAGAEEDQRSAAEVKPIPKSKPSAQQKQPPAEKTNTEELTGNVVLPDKKMLRADVWTTRTVRLRQSTATALTKATYAQRTKEADGKLTVGDPVTVQEIADHGIQLALRELGYLK